MRLAFLGFTFDPQARVLTHGTAAVRLSPKAFLLLEHLIAEGPRALSKRELMDRVWPDTFVIEANLSNLIGELRTALGDDPRTPCAIRTVPRFGYAFMAATTAIAPVEPAGAILWELAWARGRIGLAQGEHVIGRGDEADVRIESSRVSRRHARVTVSRDRLTYEDLHSKNGTFDDGLPVQGVMPVDDGQTLVIGDVDVAFRRRRRESTATMTVVSDRRPGVRAPATSIRRPRRRP